ncbi:tail assembly chaperone [Metabacillus idriensis]|uniref:tail assembly chaperone n=1 Tax=Metabacillus idriensis TaxID=324768 RepID=UPI00174D402A|nr:tail assembly chaperone [Metabacillus idriensis]
MAFLTINGTEHEAKFNFKFSKLADEKYGTEDEKGKKSNGFHNVYMGLLQASNESLVQFWDCGLNHLKGKDKPSLEAIEDAIAERIEEDGDSEPMLKEAYQAIDQSGFFKQQSKKFWKNIELMKSTGKTEEEKDRNQKIYEMLIESKKELAA